ncbi:MULTISPECIES: RbsD/FucU domain-containing protein [unclassified Actinobaculum]|uniref:RbsD/FucU family protein n=1 Tax=unclassified Actinobaculum TaxID=2609299 RepID=UPI000D52651D|nr:MULTISPECIES: RbsD/FucU domain-containing protein [unclassified Actinobaculum]AWE43019.1 fucose-binding protein [Actinobaculum sp. 313]RTE48594.1 fucose-binding protein [Actinobaculum sp. 352]
MLKNIDPRLHPDLLYVLARMGHGDRLAVVDRNFPAESLGREVVRLDGLDIPSALEALLTVFPIDTFIDQPVAVMLDVQAPDVRPNVQAKALAQIEAVEQRPIGVEGLERFEFYQRTKSCYAVLTTTEDRPYGCFILTKGVV